MVFFPSILIDVGGFLCRKCSGRSVIHPVFCARLLAEFAFLSRLVSQAHHWQKLSVHAVGCHLPWSLASTRGGVPLHQMGWKTGLRRLPFYFRMSLQAALFLYLCGTWSVSCGDCYTMLFHDVFNCTLGLEIGFEVAGAIASCDV